MTRKPPTKKPAKPSVTILQMKLGRPETLAQKCRRLAKRLRTARAPECMPQPLSQNDCLTVAVLLELLAKSGLGACLSIEKARALNPKRPSRRK